MIAYIETSAAAKLVLAEPETEALKEYLDQLDTDDGGLYSGLLLETELRRAAVRRGAPQEKVTDVLEWFDLVDLDPTIYREAGLMPGTNLRSLDALHVVVALRVGADVFISYDTSQAKAASAAGLRTVSPN
ncbi:MAG: type II toxin-antitoxin system VapC family toxin [Thermoleophilia bacterium]|nr:type II toxin-antitoxin system VapC family toxin [Thermoleophilia bacterium]